MESPVVYISGVEWPRLAGLGPEEVPAPGAGQRGAVVLAMTQWEGSERGPASVPARLAASC